MAEAIFSVLKEGLSLSQAARYVVLGGLHSRKLNVSNVYLGVSQKVRFSAFCNGKGRRILPESPDNDSTTVLLARMDNLLLFNATKSDLTQQPN